MSATTASPPRATEPGVLGRLFANKVALVGLLLLLIILAIAVFGRFWFPGDPWEMGAAPMLWPGEEAGNPLGTDFMGRDLATDLVSGAGVSLMIGFVSTGIAVVVGIGLGVISGYFGGAVDQGVTWLVELFQTIPSLVLAVILVAVFKPSITMVVIAIATVSWPPTARLMRQQVQSLRHRDFVLAGEAMGMSHTRLIFSQILPNALPPILSVATLTVAHAIQAEAALAFLGLGDPNVMSWGTIINSGREQLADAWYICGLPGFAILLTVLGFNFLGDGLNDAMNPHLRDHA